MAELELSSVLAELVINIVNIVVLFVVLRMLVYKPVKQFMQQRSERVQAQMDEAKQMRLQAEEQRLELEEQTREHRHNAETIIQTAEEHAAINAQQITAQANRKAQAIIEQARELTKQEHEQTMLGLKDEVAALSLDIAQKILGREVKQTDNQAIIDEFFQKVG